MENNGAGCVVFIVLAVIIALTAFITNTVHYKKPQAMDVYQGKTTLEYKVVDGEIVDSCVVWKSK